MKNIRNEEGFALVELLALIVIFSLIISAILMGIEHDNKSVNTAEEKSVIELSEVNHENLYMDNDGNLYSISENEN